MCGFGQPGIGEILTFKASARVVLPVLKIPLQRQHPTDTEIAFWYPSHYKYY
jgi:hypothetical protein